MEKIEIRPNERFPAMTRMDYPDMSYEHELLNTPIPFANRIEFLSDFVKPLATQQTAEDISKILCVTVRGATIMANELGSPFTMNENNMPEYDLYTLEVIEAELEWQKDFDELNEYISVEAMANYLGKTRQWVVECAAGLDQYPEYRSITINRPVLSYPKNVAYMLRTINLHFPPANNLYNLAEAVELVGKSSTWIKKTVEQHELSTDLRTNNSVARVGAHYPQTTIDELCKLKAELPDFAGNRYTAHKIGVLLGKSDRWVNRRLVPYTLSRQTLLGDSARPETYYSQKVFSVLEAESKETPPAGDWLTENEMVVCLSRSLEWVRNRTKAYRDLSENRLLKSNNRPCRHYPPEVLESLLLLNS